MVKRKKEEKALVYKYVIVSILRVPTTQLAKMSVDLKFVELTADVLQN